MQRARLCEKVLACALSGGLLSVTEMHDTDDVGGGLQRDYVQLELRKQTDAGSRGTRSLRRLPPVQNGLRVCEMCGRWRC